MKSETETPEQYIPPGKVGRDKLLYMRDAQGKFTPIVINSIDATQKTITAFNFNTKTVETVEIKYYRFFENLECRAGILIA
ncbi:hypothetical protein [Pseudomonas sp. SDO52101_S400]